MATDMISVYKQKSRHVEITGVGCLDSTNTYTFRLLIINLRRAAQSSQKLRLKNIETHRTLEQCNRTSASEQCECVVTAIFLGDSPTKRVGLTAEQGTGILNKHFRSNEVFSTFRILYI